MTSTDLWRFLAVLSLAPLGYLLGYAMGFVSGWTLFHWHTTKDSGRFKK